MVWVCGGKRRVVWWSGYLEVEVEWGLVEWDPDGRQDDQVYQDPEEEGDEAEE